MPKKLIYTLQQKSTSRSAAHANTHGKQNSRKILEDNRTTTIQPKKNKTGLPDNLKSGIENLSGHSLDDVKVHYNSSKPAQLNAHAYAKGSTIHLASGQEKHLPHEAWHIVQQKQGRVRPTKNINGAKINDDAGLEKEADIMGEKALQRKEKTSEFKNNSNAQAVMQFAKPDAQKFIDEKNLKINANQGAVEDYVNDITNPTNLRKGLLDAWNKPTKRKLKRKSFLMIKTPNDLKPTSTTYETKQDLNAWDSDTEDTLDLKNAIMKNSKGSMDIERTNTANNKLDVPIIDIFDAVRFGRQSNKRDDYSNLPLTVNLGGHHIEFDNPGTKDIYATPLHEIIKEDKLPNKEEKKTKRKEELRKKVTKKIYKRSGSSSDYNWINLSKHLDNQKYADPKKKQLEILRFYIKKSKDMKIDGPIAEALAAIGSDLMKGSKGGRFFLHKAIREIEDNDTVMPFRNIFTGNNPTYIPAAQGGRSKVTKKTIEIFKDADELSKKKNSLINVIARAALGHTPTKFQIMRIREQVESYDKLTTISLKIILLIREILNIQNPIDIVYSNTERNKFFPGTGNTITIYNLSPNNFTEHVPPVAKNKYKTKD